uniref:Uncharacterized protein n=1 Tax=Rhizophora mucronata TaxID=61149 RepID=A0A2P2PLQ0_RHIMU
MVHAFWQALVTSARDRSTRIP